MPKQTAEQPVKIEVPVTAPTVLVTLNGMLRTRRQELQVLVESGQAYANSVGLDPAKDYRFVVEDEKVYAVEQEAPTVKVAEAKE